MAKPLSFTVIGTAVGALAVAAELRLKGRQVTVTSRPEETEAVQRLAQTSRLHLTIEAPTYGTGLGETVVEGMEFIPDLREAVRGRDVVIVMVPPNFHEALLDVCRDFLRDDQILLLSPGGLGGSLLASRIAHANGAPGLLIAQTAAMPHAAHEAGENRIRISGKKKTLPVGVFPALRGEELLSRLGEEFPQFVASAHVIENGLARAGLGLHPIPMIMNATQVEQRGSYLYDGYDITPSVARVIDRIDEERQAILSALGSEVTTFSDILTAGYGVTGDSFYEMVHKVGSYRQAKSPPDINYRYLSEDVPTQVVPAASLARSLEIPTPMLDAVVAFTSAMHGVDYWKTGWNLEKLGLDGLTPQQIVAFVQDGKR